MRPPSDLLVPPTDRRRQLAPVGHDGRDADLPTDDLDWLHDVLGASLAEAPRPWVGRVVDGELRLLVPATRQAVVAALRRPADDRGLLRRAQGVAGRNAARLGLLGFLPGQRLTLAPFALVDHLAAVLDQPSLTATVTLGPRRRNRKPVLQLLTSDGNVAGYAKVGWSPLTTALVDNEAHVLGLVAGRLPAGVTAPAVTHRGPWLSGSVTVTSPLQLAGRRRAGATDPVALARAIAACDARPPTPVVAIPALIEWRASGLGPGTDLDAVVRRHRDVELALGLWHGDLTPWNLATGDDGTVLWDWEFAGPGRPVGFDLLHHHFEIRRRSPGATSRAALDTVLADAPHLLEPLVPDLGAAQRAALIDLYLCELLAREQRLSDQRWTSTLADLAPAAADLLRSRLA